LYSLLVPPQSKSYFDFTKCPVYNIVQKYPSLKYSTIYFNMPLLSKNLKEIYKNNLSPSNYKNKLISPLQMS
jgi:hypothetical protein